MTILSTEMIKVIETTNAMIETNRGTNKANTEAINKGNVEIYATTVASFSKYKADTISTKDVKIFRGQCSDDCLDRCAD